VKIKNILAKQIHYLFSLTEQNVVKTLIIMKLSFALFLAFAPLASAQDPCAGISTKVCKSTEGCIVDKGSCVSTAPTPCVSGSG
jgi:hypothetical protein